MGRPRIIIGTPFNMLNDHHIRRWVEFHSRYADKLIVSIDKEETEALRACGTIEYLLSKGVEILSLDLQGDKNSINKIQFLVSRMEHLNPEWFGVVASDEIFSDNFLARIDDLLQHKENGWYSFPVLHLWGDERHNRVDSWFAAGLTNVEENKKIWQNVFKDYYMLHTGLHSSLVPAQVRTDHRGEFIDDIKVLHYAFVDPQDWPRRCAYYGTEYEFGGGKNGYGPADNVELREV